MTAEVRHELGKKTEKSFLVKTIVYIKEPFRLIEIGVNLDCILWPAGGQPSALGPHGQSRARGRGG